jgi:antitoxin ParD1/3/4
VPAGRLSLTGSAESTYGPGMTDQSASTADTSINVLLSEALKDYVQRRVAEGAFRDPSDFVVALICEDRKRQAEARLEALLLEGLDSGPAELVDWPAIREEAYRRAGVKPPAEA